jgi:hypothetical protein
VSGLGKNVDVRLPSGFGLTALHLLSRKAGLELASIMAYDDIKTAYHLTSDGWKTGNPPADRIETWICHKYQASAYSRTLISWRCTWADPGMPRPDRDKVRAKYKEFIGRPGRTALAFLAKKRRLGSPFDQLVKASMSEA